MGIEEPEAEVQGGFAPGPCTVAPWFRSLNWEGFLQVTVQLPWWLVVGNPLANAGDVGLIPGLERSPGGGNGNPLQYSCLENPMDRGAWRAAILGVAKSQT